MLGLASPSKTKSEYLKNSSKQIPRMPHKRVALGSASPSPGASLIATYLGVELGGDGLSSTDQPAAQPRRAAAVTRITLYWAAVPVPVTRFPDMHLKLPCSLAQGIPSDGRIFDECGNRMSPRHSNGGGVRYRYYISHAVIQGQKTARAT